jgi:hypothetical protein
MLSLSLAADSTEKDLWPITVHLMTILPHNGQFSVESHARRFVESPARRIVQAHSASTFL